MTSILKIYVLTFICTALLDKVVSLYINRTEPKVHFWDLEKGLTIGNSLEGSTVRELQSGQYRIESSGSVENYCKWPLHVITNEIAAGVTTKKLVDVVQPGVKEGFASRHTSVTATGIWMRHSLLIDDDILLHFMYSAPSNFDFYSNWLAVAACPASDALCRSMDANKMYYNEYPFMYKGSCYRYVGRVKSCYDNVCITGWMEGTHRPVIRIKVLPKSYHDLSFTLRKKLTGVTEKNYQEYMDNLR